MNDYIDWMNVHDPELSAADGERKQVEPGEYDFEIVEVKQDQSRNGNPTLVTINKVISDGAAKGRQMRNFYSLKGDSTYARARLKALIEATGIPVDDRGAFSAQAFVGCRYHGKVVEEEFTARNDQTGAEEQRSWSKITCETSL